MISRFTFGAVQFTGRELDIVKLVHQGMMNKEVAGLLGIGTDTVKNYLRVIYDKTGMGNRTELALWWEQNAG